MREKGQYPPKGLSSCSPSFLSVPPVAEVLISKQKWEPDANSINAFDVWNLIEICKVVEVGNPA